MYADQQNHYYSSFSEPSQYLIQENHELKCRLQAMEEKMGEKDETISYLEEQLVQQFSSF